MTAGSGAANHHAGLDLIMPPRVELFRLRDYRGRSPCMCQSRRRLRNCLRAVLAAPNQVCHCCEASIVLKALLHSSPSGTYRTALCSKLGPDPRLATVGQCLCLSGYTLRFWKSLQCVASHLAVTVAPWSFARWTKRHPLPQLPRPSPKPESSPERRGLQCEAAGYHIFLSDCTHQIQLANPLVEGVSEPAACGLPRACADPRV